jgi:transcription antitermination factor NusG
MTPMIVDRIEIAAAAESHPWYGIRTRSNHESVAAIVLRGKGYEPYLPVYRTHHRRLERSIESEYPLFPGYIFCRFDAKKRLPILMTSGVVSIVGFGKEPAPIPDCEIEAVRVVLRSGLHAEPCPYLQEGQRVRILHGSLEGVEGTLLKRKNHVRMVISVTMLQRSISVEIDRDRLLAI